MDAGTIAFSLVGIGLFTVFIIVVWTTERRANEKEQRFEKMWGDLARYNSEVARGIVHTPEYDTKMKQKQQHYTDSIIGDYINPIQRPNEEDR